MSPRLPRCLALAVSVLLTLGLALSGNVSTVSASAALDNAEVSLHPEPYLVCSRVCAGLGVDPTWLIVDRGADVHIVDGATNSIVGVLHIQTPERAVNETFHVSRFNSAIVVQVDPSNRVLLYGPATPTPTPTAPALKIDPSGRVSVDGQTAPTPMLTATSVLPWPSSVSYELTELEIGEAGPNEQLIAASVSPGVWTSGYDLASGTPPPTLTIRSDFGQADTAGSISDPLSWPAHDLSARCTSWPTTTIPGAPEAACSVSTRLSSNPTCQIPSTTYDTGSIGVSRQLTSVGLVGETQGVLTLGA